METIEGTKGKGNEGTKVGECKGTGFAAEVPSYRRPTPTTLPVLSAALGPQTQAVLSHLGLKVSV